MQVEAHLEQLADQARQVAKIYREHQKVPPGVAISFVVVVGGDDSTLIHPYGGDALHQLVTTAGLPMHEVWSDHPMRDH